MRSEAVVMLGGAALLLAIGLVVVGVASRARRRRWRHAEPFAGDERGAPEPALVPLPILYLVYLGWLLVAGGAGLSLIELLT